MKSRLNKSGLIVILVMAFAVLVEAASITLGSINSGVFQYQLTLAPGESVVFNQNDQINLIGLTGVTATAPIDIGFTSCGFSGATACFAEIFTNETLLNSGSSPTMIDLFSITSTSNSVGLLDYTAQANTPFSGQVDGPTAAPEPGSGFLTAAGLIVLLLPARRFFRQS